MSVPLSPLFLVKRGAKNMGLVGNGKYRLMVSRVINALDVPFMVGSEGNEWVQEAFLARLGWLVKFMGDRNLNL